MSAHSRPLAMRCSELGCTSRPTERVFNTYNAPQGEFCKKHAAKRVKALQQEERRAQENDR